MKSVAKHTNRARVLPMIPAALVLIASALFAAGAHARPGMQPVGPSANESDSPGEGERQKAESRAAQSEGSDPPTREAGSA